jgi:hypothetical protein
VKPRWSCSRAKTRRYENFIGAKGALSAERMSSLVMVFLPCPRRMTALGKYLFQNRRLEQTLRSGRMRKCRKSYAVEDAQFLDQATAKFRNIRSRSMKLCTEVERPDHSTDNARAPDCGPGFILLCRT